MVFGFLTQQQPLWGETDGLYLGAQEQKQTWCLLGAEITASMGHCAGQWHGVSPGCGVWKEFSPTSHRCRSTGFWAVGGIRGLLPISSARSRFPFDPGLRTWLGVVGLLGSDSSRAWRRRLGSGEAPVATFLPRPTCCEHTSYPMRDSKALVGETPAAVPPTRSSTLHAPGLGPVTGHVGCRYQARGTTALR